MASIQNKTKSAGKILIQKDISGDILLCPVGLSFWGGVDPDTGNIIDIHHPCYTQNISGKILMMPSSRGSCSGSGVLLELCLKNIAPAAIIFHEAEEILSLGALVSERIFDKPVPVITLNENYYQLVAQSSRATIHGNRINTDVIDCELTVIKTEHLFLSEYDKDTLEGKYGNAAKTAMEIICLMAAANNTNTLIDIKKGHIDGCILAHSANLIFAERLAKQGAQVCIPTTINAISVDRENWVSQMVPTDFGNRASRLADAYVKMGAKPVFTCAPYLLDDKPKFEEVIGWSESNAVLFANSVLGARTLKHPDYLDLFIAITGRAPKSGVYLDEGRIAQTVISVEIPNIEPDDLFWSIIGWVAGKLSPNKIPLIIGLEHLKTEPDDLKALCAAFGTTSGASMLHILGHTPEAHLSPLSTANSYLVNKDTLKKAWEELNKGEKSIDLVAIGSPHASFDEVKKIKKYFLDRKCHPGTTMIITVGRQTLGQLKKAGIYQHLLQSDVQIISDICWCSITEPVFPPKTRNIITNSGKYAHYSHGLSGRYARLSSLKDCVEAAVTGLAPKKLPIWL